MPDRDISARFASDTAKHTMTVLHDDGLYRHLRFRAPETGIGWFDLITVPGALIFQEDGSSLVFRRIEDMFEFFRGQRINPGYWAEKLTSGCDQVMKYQLELLQKHVDDLVAEAIADEEKSLEEGEDRLLGGLADAIRDHITDELGGYDESLDRDVVDRFRYWANPDDEFAHPRKSPDFEFTDTWEWTVRDYDWWFLWALHGIVWGIAQYDASRQQAEAVEGQLASGVSR